MILFDDEYYMNRALMQAQQASDEGEVPVGAIAVRNGVIIASAYNQVETLKDATAHAEVILLTKASVSVGDWRLTDVDVYVTKEPCPMCAGAMINSRIRRLIFGMGDPKFGAAGGIVNLFNLPELPSRAIVTGAVLADESKRIMQDFFRNKRLIGK